VTSIWSPALSAVNCDASVTAIARSTPSLARTIRDGAAASMDVIVARMVRSRMVSEPGTSSLRRMLVVGVPDGAGEPGLASRTAMASKYLADTRSPTLSRLKPSISAGAVTCTREPASVFSVTTRLALSITSMVAVTSFGSDS
jgi:hypothetical protein